MNSNRNSSASYAYYSFPPTPSRDSPSIKTSTQASPQSTRSFKSMAPSPAAGKAPQTPTKVGKNPESSSTRKLTGSAKDTPSRKPPKLGASKATPKGSTDSPKLPPRPKQTEQPESSAGDLESEAEGKIDLKDNDPSEDVEETPGKVSQPGNESASVADTSDLSEAAPDPIDESEADDTVEGAKDTVHDAAEDEGTEHGEATETEEADDEAEPSTGALGGVKSTASGVTGGVKSLASRAGGAKDTVSNAASKTSKGDVTGAATDTAGDVKDTATGAAEDAKGTAEDTAEGIKSTGEGAVKDTQDVAEDPSSVGEKATGAADDAKDTVEDTADTAKETAEEQVEDAKDKTGEVKDTADDAGDGATEQLPESGKGAVDGVKDKADDAVEGAEGTAEGAKDADDVVEGAEQTAEGAKDTAEGAVDDAKDEIPEPDLSILKGLKVNESGEILDEQGEAIGHLEEGDPADLEGYEIGDNGEILDEDGDVVGRAAILPSKAEELAGQAKDTAEETAEGAKDAAEEAVETYLPEIGVLEGLEVQEDGTIKDAEGKALGKITEGEPEDLVGMALNADGEILDEDGDVIGRAETLPQEVQKEAEGALPDIGDLEGLAVGEDGEIKNAEGVTLGKVTEGEVEDLVGKEVNAEGEILDDDGDVIGRVEVVPGEVQDAVDDAKPDAVKELEDQLVPNLTIIEGKKLNKKGNILDDEGEVLAKLVEGDAKECAGKVPNENGEILDGKGNVIGKVEIVQGEAAEEAMREAHPELVEQLDQAKEDAEKAADEAEGAAGEAKDAAEEAKDAAEEAKPDLSILEGLKVNKKGEVLNEDGEVIAKLSEGELDQVRGKKINEHGEILDSEGNIIGKVEVTQDAMDEGLVQMLEPEVGKAGFDYSILEGLKVNKNGEVLNEDGDVVAKLSEGELADVKGKKINEKGEILDKEGNVIGKVEGIPQDVEAVPEEEEAEDPDAGLPPLSILEGLKVNKAGKIVDHDGKIVGELVEGDAKKLWKAGTACDDQGQFWDNKGHVVGKAKTLPQEDKDEEAEFAGLEGLIVVKDGWVEDENGNRVGQLTEGDAKKLVGRAVDEDGDVIDKKGNVVGHAERYEEPEPEAAEEEVPIDLSELKGLIVNKQGNVIGHDGVPIGRLVEGNAKEMAGRKIGDDGQVFNDQGKVIGRCELIPENEREAKKEGPFAGLEGLVVVKDGLVEDAEHNVVGKVVEGDPKKLLGRAVDEDGDIIDKYGNVKGHCEPYEVPEEEVVEEDLSSLAGKTVNKQGKVVDEHGTIYGEIVEGDPKKLSGCKVDGQGQIWNNAGKVVGHARLVEGGADKAEGPFSNFESTIVSKDGMVKDAGGDIVGRVIEGDAKKLVGRKVDDDGDILDKNGNTIGKAERWEPEEKEREISAMAGLRVNKEGEVRDKNGDVIGRLTDGNLLHCVGKEINDNGYVVDQDGNRVGEVTLLENIPEEEVEEGPTEEEVKKEEEREIAKKIGNILDQTIEKMEPICKQITDVSPLPQRIISSLTILGCRESRTHPQGRARRRSPRQSSQASHRRWLQNPRRMQRRHSWSRSRWTHCRERQSTRSVR